MSDVVVFTGTNARIIKNVGDLEKYRGWPNAVIDPDLSKVDTVPPHYWKLVRGKVLPMDSLEIKARDKNRILFGMDNVVRSKKYKKEWGFTEYWWTAAVVLTLMTLVVWRFFSG